MTKPHSTFRAIVTLFGVVVAGTLAQAQETKKKGFEYADKKKPAPPAITVIRDEEGRPVKIWKLETAGRAAAAHTSLVPVVESVTLYSNKIMRFQFSIRNSADSDKDLCMNFNRFYLTDVDGEKYNPLARDIVPEARGPEVIQFQAGTKTRFWMEFEAPKKPESKFKVFPATDPTSDGHSNYNEFPPFIITLKEPISAAIAPTEAEAKAGAETKATAATGTPPARVTLARNAKFEGTSGKTDEDEVRTVLVLTPDPEDEEGVKAEFFPKKSPTNKTLLEGWIVPDVDNPARVQLKLKGTGVTYRLTFDGKSLTGTDSKGVKHNFRPVAK